MSVAGHSDVVSTRLVYLDGLCLGTADVRCVDWTDYHLGPFAAAIDGEYSEDRGV